MFLRIIITSFILLPFLIFFSIALKLKPIIMVKKEDYNGSKIVGSLDNSLKYESIVAGLKILPVAEEKKIIKTELDSNLILTSRAAVVVDLENQKIIYQKEAEQKFPIASLSKLMAAIVFIESDVDLDKEIIFTEEDNEDLKTYFPNGEAINSLYIKPGEKLKVKDLLYSSLVGSANNAILALVRSAGPTRKEFVKKMNEKAKILGLENTFFKDPTGLDAGNVSTALEVAKLADYAFKNGLINKITTTAKYSFQTINTKKWYSVINTNWLINSLPGLFGSKTGYLSEAGSCVAAGISENDKKFIIVLLGTKDSKTRFEELKYATEQTLKFKNQKTKIKKGDQENLIFT